MMGSFPGCLVIRNLPANAGDTGKEVPTCLRALSLCVTTTEARTSRAYTLQQERTPQ